MLKYKINRKIIRYVLAAFLATGFGSMQAQDLVLSQPYAGSLYLGPSFAGMTNGGRAFLTYRNQWPGFSGGYNTALMGGDFFFRRQNSSVGAFLTYDRQVGGAFTTISLHPQYNYRVRIGENLFFRPGVELAVYYKEINPGKFIFADQITDDGTIDGASSANFVMERGTNVDVAVSALLYNSNFWLGGAIHHISETEVAFLTDVAKTPRKWSGFAGYRFIYYEDRQSGFEDTFTLAGIFDYQSNYTQLQLGIFWHMMPLELGLWYRDLPLPFMLKDGRVNRDALIGIAGLSFGNFKISYSYDMTLSNLSGQSGGAHEIVLTLKFNQKDENDLSFFCY
jgi:type IX secretion system PorP/SprF family membrane protein